MIMCAVCATTPALVYGAATTKLNLPGITGAISRKKLLIFVPIISDCLKKSSRKPYRRQTVKPFTGILPRHPAAVLTIRMMQTAEIPTTGMSGMDRNHLSTTAIFFPFLSEFGFQSFPCAKTVNSFTLEDDRNIFSRVMESHQKNDAANGKMLYYLSENLRYPKDLTHLLYASQVLQGMAIKYGVDHWR